MIIAIMVSFFETLEEKLLFGVMLQQYLKIIFIARTAK
jgi:hypothetical protein